MEDSPFRSIDILKDTSLAFDIIGKVKRTHVSL